MVVFTDMFTKQIFCAPVRMKGTTAEKVVERFILHVFRTQGLPKSYFQIVMPSLLQPSGGDSLNFWAPA